MGNTEPRRVLVSVSRKSPHYSNAWTSCQEVIHVALRVMSEQGMIASTPDDVLQYQLLATERWDLRTYIVFDMFNELYDPDTAHLPGRNDLPVISVFLHGSGKQDASTAGKPIESWVNREIRDIHNSTGPQSRPPFKIDHANGNVPYYPNPRTCIHVGTSHS